MNTGNAGSGIQFEEFLAAFKSQHLKEWEKVQREYAKHERTTKRGKPPNVRARSVHAQPAECAPEGRQVEL